MDQGGADLLERYIQMRAALESFEHDHLAFLVIFFSSEKKVSWCEFYSISFGSPSTHQSSLTASSLCLAFVQNTYRQTRPFDLFDVRARNQNNQNNAHERLMWLIRPAQPEQEHERMPSSPRTHEHYLSTSIMHKQLRTHTHALELHSHVTSPWGFFVFLEIRKSDFLRLLVSTMQSP